MKLREEACFGTELFKVLKFLDPRLKHRLSVGDEQVAMKAIIAMENRMFGTDCATESTSTFAAISASTSLGKKLNLESKSKTWNCIYFRIMKMM